MEKKAQKVKFGDFWLNLWKLLKPSQKQIKILLVLIFLGEFAQLLSPYFLKVIIDKLAAFDASELLPMLYLIAFMFLSDQLCSLLGYFTDRKIFDVIVNAEYYLPLEAQKKLIYLPLSYHEKENTGNKIVKIERGVHKIVDLIGDMSWEVFPTLIQMAITIIVLFAIDFRFALSLLVFSPWFIKMTYQVNKNLYEQRKTRHLNYEKASGKMTESILNINTVKSFVQEKREVREFEAIKKKIQFGEFREWWKILNMGLGRNLIIDLGRMSIVLLGAFFVWKGEVTIGTLVFAFTLSEKAYFSLYRLSRFYDRLEEGAEGVSRFMNLSREKSAIANPKNGFKPNDIEGMVEFENVSFSYDAEKQKVLDGINLKINSGCATAIVGPSGGGKTTLARLIYRHYDPQEGRVLLDDRDLKEYDLYDFRKFISIVPQEVEIFNMSVRDNIAYAKKDVSFKQIQAAARIANAEEFILGLGKGYDTLVGERGIKLSGGQRQRIGIARAVLANPRILIFDEATSNLDSYSEKLIQKALEKLSQGRTTIIIAHRLSTIKKADKIVVLEKGKVVEEGSHYELSMVDGGLYSKLLKLQKMGDVE